MDKYPQPIEKLINSFSRLPTIGPKTAERLVFYLLKKSNQNLEELADNLLHVKENIKLCSLCHNFSETDPCHICSDRSRRPDILCVISCHQDLRAIERTGNYHGLYFILNGNLEPLQGTGPDDIKIPKLLTRLQSSPVPIKEIILAFNPDINGETTVLYLTRILKKMPIKITRLARGLPVGADLEYADEITLTEAIKNRREL